MTTPNFGLRYPVGGSNFDPNGDIQRLAEDVDAALLDVPAWTMATYGPGWSTYSSYIGARWRIDGGFTVIDGMVIHSSGTQDPVFVLPPEARPTNTIFIPVRGRDAIMTASVNPLGEVALPYGSGTHWISITCVIPRG